MRNFYKVITFILFFLFVLFKSSFVLSKSNDVIYNEKSIKNYFFGRIAASENDTNQAFYFFKKAKSAKNEYDNFNIQFLRTLVLLGKFDKSFEHVQDLSPEKINFLEANILLGLSYFVKNDLSNAEKHFSKLNYTKKNSHFLEKNMGYFLNSIVKMSENNLFESLRYINLSSDRLINLKRIQESFTQCYFDTTKSETYFLELTNDKDNSFSRYNFFLVNTLIHNNNFRKAEEIIKKSKFDFESNILIQQSHDLILKENYKQIKNFFNCKNPKDVMAEFFYIMANYHASEDNFILSNFYLKISLFLNKKFLPNQALLADNYYQLGKYAESRDIYNSIKKVGKHYSWYASKRIANIITKTDSTENAISFLRGEMDKIKKPDFYHYYDLADYLKSDENYKEAAEHYSTTLNKIEENSNLIPEILRKRGISYERLKLWSKAETDLIESLRLKPDQPYVLNYLAYSWLEKEKNLDESLEMLIKAVEMKPDDGYIIDSLGWGYYLTKNYIKAEELLRRAIEIMPNDPVIHDHYGDVLWKLNKKIQARYFWNHALDFKTLDEKLINKINNKIVVGLAERS